jgi:hypothetical protein
MIDAQLTTSITDAIRYLEQCGEEIPLDITLKARQFGALKAEGDIVGVSAAYHDAITAALLTFFEGGSVTAPRNAFKRAAVEALGDGFDLGYSEAGGELPIDGDALDWLNARIEQEMAYIGQLFQQVKELRKEEDTDPLAWVSSKADAYAASCRETFNAGKMYGSKNMMLLWQYGDADHCATCEKLNGQKHRATWYLARNYIPRKPGASMDCGGYRCKCTLLDKDGNEFTI